MGPRKNSEGRGPDYETKRARNNEAVKRSREKARQKAKETHDRVSKLKQENEKLEERIKLLSKELTFLKDIFLAHAGTLIVHFSDSSWAVLLGLASQPTVFMFVSKMCLGSV